jgi:hypothetical protein
MAKHKSIRDILWDVDEKTYREDPSYHYSLLSDFRSVGIHKANELFDKSDTKKPSKSLVFGSLVDAMLTDPSKLSQFQNTGSEKDEVKLTPSEKITVDFILSYKDVYDLERIATDMDLLYDAFVCSGTYLSMSRNKVIEKHAAPVIEAVRRALQINSEKMTISEEDFVDALECKDAIMTSSMREYFEPMPFDDDVERVFQAKIKFRDEKTNIWYRVMLDSLLVNHTQKTIQPNDLKTTSDHEDEFYRNFIKWNYDIQARLYWRALYHLTQADDYFRDFEILPFQFLVVSRYSKTPMIWRYDDSCKLGQLVYLKRDNTRIVLEDPFVLGKLLHECEVHPGLVRPGTSTISANLIEHWIENGD